MYKKSPQGWLKHWDFILLDIFCLQLAFVVAYLVRQGLENPYSDQIYRTVAFVFMLCQIVVMFLGQSYQDILKRGYYIEFTKTAKHTHKIKNIGWKPQYSVKDGLKRTYMIKKEQLTNVD